MHFEFRLLETITNNFSDENKVGRGVHGKVYKGEHNGQEIAVKKYYVLNHNEFYNAFCNHTKVKHQNIVQLIGYCYDSQYKYIEHHGELVLASTREQLLCFEYMKGGSLDKYITDESCDLDWTTCYQIIKGISDGLYHLHGSQTNPIFHLNLKPSKILLDTNMTAKITDFGLSSLVASTDETYRTEIIKGTRGYMPPEYINCGDISQKYDVFSLGVILLKLMDGNRGHSRFFEMGAEPFIKHVCENWKKRLEAKSENLSDKIDTLRVIKTCVGIGTRSVADDPNKRPSIKDIVNELGELEVQIKKSQSKDLIVEDFMHLPYDLLKDITSGFSEERRLGSGSYGSVYKGLQKDGKEIAVKMLYDMPGLDEKQFKMELNNLINLRHPNIVCFLGYCHETRPECVQQNGGLVVADRTRRALCFQYMSNGSLHENIYDEYNGHDWQTRYGIIKGICNGLKYLHEELEPPMYHLDLKPANVLLDENMTPRIADFGLSRLFGQDQTLITRSNLGTRGYIPPEYIDKGVVSIKFDIFSLGVIIIKIMTGPTAYFRCVEMSSQECIDHVHAKWMDRLKDTSSYRLEAYSKQVKRCIEIGLSCVEADRRERPSIGNIVNQLKETDFRGLLDVRPLQLHFPFEPNELISCPLHLTNNTDHHVGFRCVPKNPQSCFVKLSQLRGILPPRSTCTSVVTMEKQQEPPANMETLDVIVQSILVSDDTKERALSDSFFAQERYDFGGEVDEATITAVCVSKRDSGL